MTPILLQVKRPKCPKYCLEKCLKEVKNNGRKNQVVDSIALEHIEGSSYSNPTQAYWTDGYSLV